MVEGFKLPESAPAIAGTVLVVFTVATLYLARPSDAKDKLAALERTAGLADIAGQAGGDLTKFPAGTACPGRLNDAYRNKLRDTLTAANLNLQSFALEDRGRVGTDHPMRSYSLTLKAAGPYDGVVTALSKASQLKPAVFVDRLNLRGKTTVVELELEGRVFCRWTESN